MFFIACAFKGHVHAFAGRVKVVSHSSCRTSAIFKYFCPLQSMSYEICAELHWFHYETSAILHTFHTFSLCRVELVKLLPMH